MFFGRLLIVYAIIIYCNLNDFIFFTFLIFIIIIIITIIITTRQILSFGFCQ